MVASCVAHLVFLMVMMLDVPMVVDVVNDDVVFIKVFFGCGFSLSCSCVEGDIFRNGLDRSE